MRRDKNDSKWQACKQEVFKLDKGSCLLCENLSVAENIRFQKSIIPFGTLGVIDPAHHLPVSKRPDIMYDVNNVFSLCRCHHERLDNGKNPITGDFCSQEDTEYWWQRIIKQRESNLEESKNFSFTPFYSPL